MIPALLGMLEGLSGGASAAGAAAGSGSVLSADLTALTKNLGSSGSLKAFNTEFSKVSQGFGEVQKLLGPAQQALGAVKQTGTFLAGLPNKIYEAGLGMAQKVAGLPGLITKPMQDAIGVIGAFRDSVTGLGSAVSSFTQLANPALTQQFMFAAEDLTASLGRGLLPVLELATSFTRMFGDAVFTLSGPFQQLSSSFLKPVSDLIPTVTNAVGPLVRSLGGLMSTAAALVRPFTTWLGTLAKIAALPMEGFFRSVELALELLNTPLELFGAVLTRLAQQFDRMVTKALAWVRALTGLSDAPGMAGASRGAAVRPAHFTGAEDFERQFFAKSFSLGTGASPPEERTAKAADAILAVLNQLPQKMWEKFKTLAADIGREIRNAPREAADSVADTVAATVPGGATVTKKLDEMGGRLRRGLRDLRDRL
jgi:hypothetical protein